MIKVISTEISIIPDLSKSEFRRKIEFNVEIENSLFGIFLKRNKIYECSATLYGFEASQLYVIKKGCWLVELIWRNNTNIVERNIEQILKGVYNG